MRTAKSSCYRVRGAWKLCSRPHPSGKLAKTWVEGKVRRAGFGAGRKFATMVKHEEHCSYGFGSGFGLSICLQLLFEPCHDRNLVARSYPERQSHVRLPANRKSYASGQSDYWHGQLDGRRRRLRRLGVHVGNLERQYLNPPTHADREHHRLYGYSQLGLHRGLGNVHGSSRIMSAKWRVWKLVCCP